jgi:hypothetical protein
LILDSELGLSQYTQPPSTLQVHVDSPLSPYELLFFPFDADDSFESIQKYPCVPSPVVGTTCSVTQPEVPAGHALGHMHRGGDHTVGIGTLLGLANGGTAQAIKSLYMRRHGECETEVRWEGLLGAVLSGIKNSSDCKDTWLGCFDYDVKFSKRIAISYLRQQWPYGRGGFGLYVDGETSFDSPFICDLDFAGKAGYDVTLSDEGLPVFGVSAGPFARAWNCSSSPACTCKNSDVRDGVKDDLKNDVTAGLNELIAECLAVPANTLGPPTCTSAEDCAVGLTASILGGAAVDEAKARGADDARREAFRAAMTEPTNWTCARVKPECSALTQSEPTTEPVCQLKLRARDLIPMPDSLSLVWYTGGLGGPSPTAAEALYLALTNLGQSDALSALCTQPSSTFWGMPLRAFARVTK